MGQGVFLYLLVDLSLFLSAQFASSAPFALSFYALSALSRLRRFRRGV